MAIVIPSSKTYNRQNPKVRDNVIERIEVGAVEVLSNNEYETPVYNESLDLTTFIEQENNEKQRYIVDTGTDGESMYYHYAYVYLNNKIKYINKKITINKLKNNNLISNIYYGKNKDDEEEIEYSLRLKKEKKPIYAKIQMTGYQATILEKSYGEITESTEIIQTSNKRQFPIMPILISKKVFGTTASLNGVNDPTNLLISYKENEENYEIEIQILEYFYAENFKGGYDIVGPLNRPTVEINVEGEVEEYTPLSLEITLYGNTIGIDLNDKTVYIPETDKTSKKVYSVDGNELMQPTNYYVIYENPIFVTVGGELGSSADTAYYELFGEDLSVGQILHYNNEEAEITELLEETSDAYRLRIKPNGEWAKATTKTITAYLYKTIKNAINENYGKTKIDYTNGKETATIRCSVNDYFDYDSKEKIISIDNSTNKMSFKIGDQVIPMVYGADGQDRPMSTYQNGSPKVFQVLGSNIFYDGAVWQELSLQEV